ncbi:site-2 protease family protein [Hymenobacter aerilatus]|uniref:Site-2 protease family protein n=1 Tax=Hymenobacter aerilatus TaxID=2932251 RepID=A0A8T9SZ87_9BACT|nr:site-2 protease family protein [Hymenobacter aerilatus]UOR07175.1 site-2 protease family protein [Hymenobacter aerilatus]
MLSNVLLSCAVLCLLVTVHEIGHYLAALAFRIRADVFSIGFGPGVTLFRWRGTAFRLGVLPLGGYVKPREEDYEAAPAYQRVLVAAAGPLASIIFGILCVAYYVQVQQHVPYWQAVLATIGVTGKLLAMLGHKLAGVFSHPTASISSLEVADAGKASSTFTFMQQVKEGESMLYSGAISAAIGLANLLPLLPFDGGHIVVGLVEMVSRRRVPGWAQGAFALTGLALMAVLFFLSVYNDFL